MWHYREADPDLGAWQAKELLDHLEGVLANEPVEVISGQSIVEVKPQVRWLLLVSQLQAQPNAPQPCAMMYVVSPALSAQSPASSTQPAQADKPPTQGCLWGFLIELRRQLWHH